MGWFMSPHQIFAADSSFATINLSLGERPVCTPVVAAKAPLEANMPSLRANACSTSAAGERFQLIFPRLTSPYSSRALRLIIIVIVLTPPGRVGNSTVHMSTFFVSYKATPDAPHILSLPALREPRKLTKALMMCDLAGSMENSETTRSLPGVAYTCQRRCAKNRRHHRGSCSYGCCMNYTRSW